LLEDFLFASLSRPAPFGQRETIVVAWRPFADRIVDAARIGWACVIADEFCDETPVTPALAFTTPTVILFCVFPLRINLPLQ